jgi:hypothetical protein
MSGIGVGCLAQISPVFVVIEAMVTIRHDVLGANHDNALSIEKLLRKSCGQPPLHVSFSVNDDGRHWAKGQAKPLTARHKSRIVNILFI